MARERVLHLAPTARLWGWLCAALIGTAGTLAPVAHADESVTYVVDSPSIGMVQMIEFFDGTRRILLWDVALPWRITVPIRQPQSLGLDGAEIRADWRPQAAPSRWVSARVYFGDRQICENTLDVGNVACYGSTGFNTDV